jgi:hypothetical protein
VPISRSTNGCESGAENACRADEKGAQTSDDTISGAQIGRMLAAAIEYPQLMFDEHRLGNDGTEASWPCSPDYGDDQMNEKDDDIAHPGTLSNPKTLDYAPTQQFAMDTPYGWRARKLS